MKKNPKTMKKSSSSSPFADLTNNLTPFSSLRNLCNITKLPPNSTPQQKLPIARKENRVSNSVSGSSIGSSSFNRVGDSVVDPGCSYRVELIAPSRVVAPPPTPPLGETGSGEHSYSRRSSDVTPTRLASLKTSKDKGKAIAVTPLRPAPLKTVNNKGIVFVSPSDKTKSKDNSISSASDKLKVKGIETRKPSVSFGSSHLIKDNDKLKASPRKSRHPVILNDLKGKSKKTTAAPSDGLTLEIENQNALQTPLNLYSKRADHKGESLSKPSDGQPPLKPNENLVKEAEIFTCPPLPRTRSTRKRSKKAEDSELPKSWTDPHPKKPKTRRVSKKADELDFLPKDFVEKHRAYFKEVDEFELPEEEVSSDDLD